MVCTVLRRFILTEAKKTRISAADFRKPGFLRLKNLPQTYYSTTTRKSTAVARPFFKEYIVGQVATGISSIIDVNVHEYFYFYLNVYILSIT